MEDRIFPGMLAASTSTLPDPSDIKVEPDALTFGAHTSLSSTISPSRPSLPWQELSPQYNSETRRPQARKRSQTATHSAAYTNKYLRLNQLDRRRSTGASRPQTTGSAEASASSSQQQQAYSTWENQEIRGVYQGQAEPTQPSSPRRSSDGDQYPQPFFYSRGIDQSNMSNRRADVRPHSVHASPGSSSLSGAVGPVMIPHPAVFSSTPSPVSDGSLRHPEHQHVSWMENAAGLVAAGVPSHPLSSSMTMNDVGLVAYGEYGGQTYLETSSARSPVSPIYNAQNSYYLTTEDTRPSSQHSSSMDQGRPMMPTVPSQQQYQSGSRNSLMDMSSIHDAVEVGTNYSSGPSIDDTDQELVRLRSRIRDLEMANSSMQQRLAEVEHERQIAHTSFSSGLYSTGGQSVSRSSPPSSSLTPEFRAAWRARTDIRIKRFCSLNRAGNALCAWHDSRRERRAFPPRMAPAGYLNCGCTVDEALFEESLARHSVGSYHPGEMVRMDPALRNPLLKLLQRRYDYKDGDFERDPVTGGWIDGEGPEVWEQSLQSGSNPRNRRS